VKDFEVNSSKNFQNLIFSSFNQQIVRFVIVVSKYSNKNNTKTKIKEVKFYSDSV
jgi:hypothetical protein